MQWVVEDFVYNENTFIKAETKEIWMEIWKVNGNQHLLLKSIEMNAAALSQKELFQNLVHKNKNLYVFNVSKKACWRQWHMLQQRKGKTSHHESPVTKFF